MSDRTRICVETESHSLSVYFAGDFGSQLASEIRDKERNGKVKWYESLTLESLRP
jgi:hypothetical protein